VKLRDDPDLLEAAITRAVADVGIPARQLRKDFWLTEILRASAAKAELDGKHLVFKGGTSLSKVFGLIQRFSEDVDLLLTAPGGPAAVSSAMRSLAVAAEDHSGLNGTTEEATSKRGEYRAVYFPFPNAGEDDQGVKLEVGCRGGAFPHTKHSVVSIVAPLAQEQLDEVVEEAEPFEVNVLSPARTLVEKLVVIHEAQSRSAADRRQRVVKIVRHYYDVWCLLGDDTVREELRHLRADVLARDICQHSKAIGLGAVEYPMGGFAHVQAFQTLGTADQRKAYGEILPQLLWPGATMPSFDDCLARVSESAELL
jgi:hypothetical protein